MATFVEYLDLSDFSRTFSKDSGLIPVGYLSKNPEQALKDLLPNFHVIDYLNIPIPLIGEYADRNQGLKISRVPSGIGLVGTIEMLSESDLFQSCEHEPFLEKQREEIIEKMKLKLSPHDRYQEPHNIRMEKYASIFDALGYSISVGELAEFTESKRSPVVMKRGVL